MATFPSQLTEQFASSGFRPLARLLMILLRAHRHILTAGYLLRAVSYAKQVARVRSVILDIGSASSANSAVESHPMELPRGSAARRQSTVATTESEDGGQGRPPLPKIFVSVMWQRFGSPVFGCSVSG